MILEAQLASEIWVIPLEQALLMFHRFLDWLVRCSFWGGSQLRQLAIELVLLTHCPDVLWQESHKSGLHVLLYVCLLLGFLRALSAGAIGLCADHMVVF